MGKKCSKFLLLMLVVVMFAFLNPDTASAESCNVKKVDDIDNVVCPETQPFLIYGYEGITAIEFILPECGNVLGYIKVGTSNYSQGEVWISSDYEGKNVLSDTVQLDQSGYITESLDAGTYYIQVRWSQTIVEAGLAIVYEPSHSEEEYFVSSFDKPTTLEMNKCTRGFLTVNTPKDYYMFDLDETAYLDIQYSFDAARGSVNEAGEMKLYNSDQILIGSGRYELADRGLNSMKFKLEPGRYYITLNGLYSETALELIPMYYKTTITPETTEWTDENVSVKINTTIDFASIDVIKYDVTEADLSTSSLWQQESGSKKYVETNGTTFVAKSNGVYSIRIKDAVGEYTLEKITISNIDKKAPTVSGVKNGKYYKSNRTLTWTDNEGSGVKKVTLNGKTVKSGVKITKDGEYTLKLYDKLGNKRTITFVVDKTAPSITGIKNGSTYSDIVTATILDETSGVQKITINGVEEEKNNSPYYFAVAGTYKIKVWDNAGNATTVTIKMK